VDAGELVSKTLRREFTEEANASSVENKAEITEKLDELFSKGEKVFVGCTSFAIFFLFFFRLVVMG